MIKNFKVLAFERDAELVEAMFVSCQVMDEIEKFRTAEWSEEDEFEIEFFNDSTIRGIPILELVVKRNSEFLVNISCLFNEYEKTFNKYISTDKWQKSYIFDNKEDQFKLTDTITVK